MNVTSVFCQNVIGHRFSWNKCFIIYWTNTAINVAACRNTSQVVKLQMHLMRHIPVLQSWCNVMLQQNEFIERQKLLVNLVLKVMGRHYLNAFDVSTASCNQGTTYSIMTPNLLYFEYSLNCYSSIYSL